MSTVFDLLAAVYEQCPWFVNQDGDVECAMCGARLANQDAAEQPLSHKSACAWRAVTEYVQRTITAPLTPLEQYLDDIALTDAAQEGEDEDAE